MKIINVTDGMTSILIGRQGENERTQVVWDVSDWLEEYPDAAIVLINTKPNSDEEYPVVISQPEDGKVKWTVGAAELMVVGYGECSLMAVEGTVVAKKHTWRTKILKAKGQNGSTPEPWESWMVEFGRLVGEAEDAAEEAQDAEDAAEAAQAAAEDARDAAQAAAGNFQGMDATVTGLDADDEPTINVTHSEGGHYHFAFGAVPGTTYTPSVSEQGVLSWNNDGGKTNPENVNIKGPQGDPAPASAVKEAVDDWLEDNLDPIEANPPLDRSLMLSNAAAPANLVGDNAKRLDIALFGGEYSPVFKNISYTRTLIDGSYYIGENPYDSWGGIGTENPLIISDGDSISVDSAYIIKTGYIVTINRNGVKQVAVLNEIVDKNQYNFKTAGLYLIAIRKWNSDHTAFVNYDASELANSVHIISSNVTKEIATNEAYTDSRLVSVSYGGVYHPRFINGSYARVETGSDYLKVVDSTNYCVTSLDMPLIVSGGDAVDVDNAYIIVIGYRIIKDSTGVKIAEGLLDIANTNHYVFKDRGLYLIGIRKPNPGGSGYLDFDDLELDGKINITANPITNHVESLAQYTDKRLVASIDGGVYDAVFANGMVERVATGSNYVKLEPNSTYCSNDPNYPLIISKGDAIDIDSDYKIKVCNIVENDETGTKIVKQISDIVDQSHYVFKESGLYLLLIRKPTGETTYANIDASELYGKVKITTNGASSKANNVERPLNPYENLYWGGTQYITSCHAHCLTTIEGLIEAGYTALIPTNYRPPKPYYPLKYFYPDVPDIENYLAAPSTEIAVDITQTKSAHFCNPGSMLAVGTDSSATYTGTLEDLINDCRNTRKGFRVGGVIINHPSWSGLTAEDMIPALQAYSDIIGIEFYNYGCELSDGTGWAVEQWDDILSEGIQCFGFAAPDHALETASGQTDRPTGFLHVLPACPTDDALLAAIGNGRFYASIYNDGLKFTSIKKTNTKIQVSAEAETSDNPEIKFITAKRESTVSGLTGEFTFASTDIYVRIEVSNGNNTLYSNAIIL